MGTPFAEHLESLTEDERQVLELLAAGRTRKEIAVELGIAEETVLTHTLTILAKLQVHSQLDPPPSPLAASAALAVPFQRAEDVPRHVGRYVHREDSSA